MGDRLSEIGDRLARAVQAHWVAGVEILPDDGCYWDGAVVYAVSDVPVPEHARTGDDAVDDAACQRIDDWSDRHLVAHIAETHNWLDFPDEQHDANQRLIAHAPADLRYLLARLALAERVCSALVGSIAHNDGAPVEHPDLDDAVAAWIARVHA